MALLVGTVLALAVGIFATALGLDRDRAFYPTVAIVVAAYYALFAVMGGSHEALVIESLVGVAFVVAAATGFKSSLWIVAGGGPGHGIFGVARGGAPPNPGGPAGGAPVFLAYDVTAAAYLAWLIRSGRVRASA